MTELLTNLPPYTSAPPPKRRMKNYLLDPKFQLKYAGMVVVVTFIVSAVLGYQTYHYSSGQTKMLMMSANNTPGLSQNAIDKLQRDSEAEDMRVALWIGGGVLLLTVVLGLTGIFVTHRLVGPAYKLRLLMKEVQRGRLRVVGKLRKGDELQDVFIAFEKMVAAMRERQIVEIRMLEGTIEKAQKEGVSQEIVDELNTFRAHMRQELD